MKRFVIYANNLEMEQTDDILDAFDAAAEYQDAGFRPSVYDRVQGVEVTFRKTEACL